MGLTPSSMIPLGSSAPDFKLLDVISQKNLTLQDVKSDIATVIMFICNHCPYVIHLQKGLVRIAEKYSPKGISFVAINSNDIETTFTQILTSYYLLYVKAGMNLEFGLTGSKLQAVICAAVSAVLKISQSWYVRPNKYDKDKHWVFFGGPDKVTAEWVGPL